MRARTQPTPAAQPATTQPAAVRLAMGWYGIVLALALVKLGNPVVLDRLVLRPTGAGEWLFGPWPMAYGWGLLLATGWVGALVCWRWRSWPRLPVWLWAAPLLWCLWVGLTAVASIDRGMSWPVVVHYATVVACFFIGVGLLGQTDDLGAFWWGLLAGMAWVLMTGVEQHYGGLEATRRMVLEQPGSAKLPPEFLQRLEGGRVFSTLFYANTLAGVILLLLPPLAVVTWGFWPERLRMLRAVSTGLLVYAGAACLVWSGSKAGWLIAALLVGLGGWQVPMPRRWRWGLAVLVAVVAVAGFGLRFQTYLQRGATSAVARVDYWRAAVGIVAERPFLGSGPGTFELLYRERRRPESEPSRVVHNDYLQQASDSGLPGAAFYLAWVLGALGWTYGRRRGDWLGLATWLGLVGVAVQGFVEFGLLIPALAWPAMSLLGWQVARAAVWRSR